jgi:hypothetical protein
MAGSAEIALEIIADWQRECDANPVGELALDCVDVSELLRVYAAAQPRPTSEPPAQGRYLAYWPDSETSDSGAWEISTYFGADFGWVPDNESGWMNSSQPSHWLPLPPTPPASL